jgi:hypothetical protein
MQPRMTQALSALADALAAIDSPGMVIGGIAVIARGFLRTTRDIDATVEAGDVDLGELVAALTAHGIVPRIDDAVVFAKRHQVLLMKHAQTDVPIDMSLAWLPFESEAIAAAEFVEIQGVRLRVARAEDLVVYKAVAWRPQDQEDIKRLLRLHHRSIDLGRVRRLVGDFAEVMEEPERVAELERLLRRIEGR